MPSWLDAKEFRGLPDFLRAEIEGAERDLRWVESATGADLVNTAAEQLGIAVDGSKIAPGGVSALQIGEMPHRALVAHFQPHFPTGSSVANDLADQVQLCRAFGDPSAVIANVKARVAATVADFPRTVANLKVGKNPGDILDPYILAANFELLSGRSLPRSVETSLSHKVLMKVEDLVGNMHEGVLGAMRGNFRVPAPRGGQAGNKDIIHPAINPFPGADLGQVPIPGARTQFACFK